MHHHYDFFYNISLQSQELTWTMYISTMAWFISRPLIFCMRERNTLLSLLLLLLLSCETSSPCPALLLFCCSFDNSTRSHSYRSRALSQSLQAILFDSRVHDNWSFEQLPFVQRITLQVSLQRNLYSVVRSVYHPIYRYLSVVVLTRVIYPYQTNWMSGFHDRIHF